jgi:DNA repair ATPase RecN
MKHKKKNNGNTNYDIEFMQTIIDGLYERNQELTGEVERLKNEIAETNDINIKQDEDEQSYKNLSQLNTLLLVLQNMVIAHCDDSPLGQAVGKAIKKYQITMAKSLLRRTMYIKDEDREDWEDDEEEDC